MIHLDDASDPLLFSAEVPAGQIVLQYMEVVMKLQAQAGDASLAAPTPEQIVNAIRDGCRTPEVAKATPDHVLFALWHRIAMRVSDAGKA